MQLGLPLSLLSHLKWACPLPPSLVRILHNSVHSVVIQELEVGNVDGAQVQVDLVLHGHALEVVRVGHPGELIDDLGVPAWGTGGGEGFPSMH